MPEFRLNSTYSPMADQPEAINQLAEGLDSGDRIQTLLGATGTGKTFTMAGVIERVQRPALVMAHNKTLAAQLCNEFREFFPDNVVEYFVSYYDYYQPEAYVPAQDLYIEKDSSINDEIDRLRHAATAALLARRDVIIVASVSCIYGIGSPALYRDQMQLFKVGETVDRDKVLRKLRARIRTDIAHDAGTLLRGRMVTLRTMPLTVTVSPGVQQSIRLRSRSSAACIRACSSSASTSDWERVQRCHQPGSPPRWRSLTSVRWFAGITAVYRVSVISGPRANGEGSVVEDSGPASGSSAAGSRNGIGAPTGMASPPRTTTSVRTIDSSAAVVAPGAVAAPRKTARRNHRGPSIPVKRAGWRFGEPSART